MKFYLTIFIALLLNIICLGQSLVVPTGTMITCSINEHIESDRMEVGYVIQTKVSDDIRVNNKIVVRAGAPGYAEIIKFGKDNNRRYITIALYCVTAVNGQIILINSSPTRLISEEEGEFRINPGIVISGYVLNNTITNDSQNKHRNKGKTTVNAGSPVFLEILDVIDEKLNPGNILDAKVIQNLVVGGKIVIAAGAKGYCMVTDIELDKKGFVNKVLLEVRQVFAVNGSPIPLSSTKRVFQLSNNTTHQSVKIIGKIIADDVFPKKDGTLILPNQSKDTFFEQDTNSFSKAAIKVETPGKSLLPTKRLALVVGNGQYLHTTTLNNTLRDARDMRDSLRRVGFDVVYGVNLSIEGFMDTLEHFRKLIKDTLNGYEAGLFYYAGHGIEDNGNNYLVPVDATLLKKAHISKQCVHLNEVLQTLETSIKIIILDACRDNPFAKNWPDRDRTGIEKGGLSTISIGDVGFDCSILFAAAPGKTAKEQHPTRQNGFFTGMLLECITQSCFSWSEIFECTSAKMRFFAKDQIPFHHSSMTQGYYLKTCKK